VLGDRWLRDTEFGADDRSDGACGLLAISQQLQDAAPDRVTWDIECVHVDIISATANISQYLNDLPEFT
jgi:hypothetical protein